MLLLDEIEKAHPDLFNVLLQVMDHGSLTDANGRKVDFRNVILIMTTNAGASDMAKAPMGFGRERREGEDTEAINKMFTPEFRNRLDAVVGFNNLPPEVVVRVVEKFILELSFNFPTAMSSLRLTERRWIGWSSRAMTPHGRPPDGADYSGKHQEAVGR